MKELIGNTPLIKIHYRYLNKENDIYVKLEYYNLTGSIKDRMVYHILTKAKEKEELKDGMAIIEATSGNTGISLAAIGAYFSHPVYILMPNWVSRERIALIKSYGAKIKLISKAEGGFLKCIKEADELAKNINGYRPNQFENIDNVEVHYKTTGLEIINQMKNKEIGGFISGIGTGGTLIGIAKRLKENDSNTVICALEPDTLPILTTGNNKGSHKIEGIGDEFIPKIVDQDLIDQVLTVNDMDSINMARQIARELGIGVGISSGANLLGAVLLQNQIHRKVVTLFPDDNKKYLSTELSNNIDSNPNFISNKIELIDYEVII